MDYKKEVSRRKIYKLALFYNINYYSFYLNYGGSVLRFIVMHSRKPGFKSLRSNKLILIFHSIFIPYLFSILFDKKNGFPFQNYIRYQAIKKKKKTKRNRNKKLRNSFLYNVSADFFIVLYNSILIC